ncbi:glutaredoxin family protein [Candidatus Woesearchaeota archaeon]|nr:glutaredoxin family protein [Candidatus Woesearchaeota archaeon]
MATEKPKVTVYSTPTCPYCHKAKDFLKENKIEFEDIDVSKDQNKAQEMIEKSGQMGVPVIEVGDEIIVGFDKEKLKKALKI